MRSGTYMTVVAMLSVVNTLVWVIFFTPQQPTLRVSVLNVGQGDAILVQSPTGSKMLIDGGRDRSAVRDLGDELGPLNRSIDLVVETHPDQDHVGGLPAVFDQYKVAKFMAPGIPDLTSASAVLDKAVAHEVGIQSIIARRGMRIHLGGGAYADVLYPDRDPSRFETNFGSVVMHVVYGKTSFMLTGDLPSPVEDWLTRIDAGDGELPTTVLKAGHHGSKYSTDAVWLAALHPAVVAISAGKNNTYGHPNPETLDRIRAEGAQIASTIDSGTLHFISDGNKVLLK